MTEIWQLEKEIRRLQAILDDNGIDYEPEQFGPPPKPQMGPPTLAEHISNIMLSKIANRMARSILDDSGRVAWMDDMRDFGGTVWPGDAVKIGSALRIRLPTDFTVRS